MQFELTKEYFTSFKEAIRRSDSEFLKAELDKLHPADIAEIFDEINRQEAKYVFELLEEAPHLAP